MKKLLAICTLCLCFAVSKSQSLQTPSASYASYKDTTDPMMDKAMNNDMMNKDGMMMMKDGKMMVMKDGQWMAMQKTTTCSDGCKVMTNGKVMMKDGKTMMMKEGMMMDKNGMMMDSTKMMNKM